MAERLAKLRMIIKLPIEIELVEKKVYKLSVDLQRKVEHEVTRKVTGRVESR